MNAEYHTLSYSCKLAVGDILVLSVDSLLESCKLQGWDAA
jgi:hypothetical protein